MNHYVAGLFTITHRARVGCLIAEGSSEMKKAQTSPKVSHIVCHPVNCCNNITELTSSLQYSFREDFTICLRILPTNKSLSANKQAWACIWTLLLLFYDWY